ncbi:hypothetical protein F937_03084 [Acinetobacter calcoaceticus ANC 3680]|nr:hypothetical protein F937_03084 [Acinetobacter calcoaceticus ANC 3680]
MVSECMKNIYFQVINLKYNIGFVIMKFRSVFIIPIVLASACSEGGNNHTVSDTHLKKSVYSSQDELNKAAQKNDPKALYTLASTYATNSTDVEDQKKAFELFEQSAKLGNDEAMLQLGLIYQEGSSYINIDDQKALSWYKQAAKKNNAMALHNVGVAYYEGIGTKLDKKQAYEYFVKAAKLGFLQSQKIIAYQLYTGTGVKKDLKESFYWSLKAAQQGDIKSQNNVALNYEKGEGVEKDPIQAMNWFLKSANNGNPEAQYNVALKYFAGNGTDQDFDKSIEYAEKAAKVQNQAAIQLLINIYSDIKNPKYNTEKANYWRAKL